MHIIYLYLLIVSIYDYLYLLMVKELTFEERVTTKYEW